MIFSCNEVIAVHMNVIIYISTMHNQHDLSLENDCFHFSLFHLSDSEVYVICTFPFTAVMNCLCKVHSVTKESLQMCHAWQISFLVIFFISAVSMLTIIDYVMPQCIVCHIFFRGSVIGLACSLLMVWMLMTLLVLLYPLVSLNVFFYDSSCFHVLCEKVPLR